MAAIWRRASAHEMGFTLPESNSSMRRATSLFHCSSAPASTVSSRLSNNRLASAARASGGRASACFSNSEIPEGISYFTLKGILSLRLQVADFAAGQTVILAIIAEADVLPALAEDAEPLAVALLLFPVALCADERHAPRVARYARMAQVTGGHERQGQEKESREQGARKARAPGARRFLYLRPAFCRLESAVDPADCG